MRWLRRWSPWALSFALLGLVGPSLGGCGEAGGSAGSHARPAAGARVRPARGDRASRGQEPRGSGSRRITQHRSSGPEPSFEVEAPGRVVAIGDLHGDLDAARRALRLAGAIDADDRWSGGRLTVVQVGDQVDRGDDDREVLELLLRLEEEAREAGGALHVLQGNHELMNAVGDLRYVTPGGYADFADTPAVEGEDPRIGALPEQARGRVRAFTPGGPWARWIAHHPVAIRIGRTLFVHGGVLPAHARYGLGRINAEVQAWLRREGPPPMSVVASSESPVWTRLYSEEPDAQACAVLEEALRAAGADRMIVAHTPHTEGIRADCGERVWVVDVGLARYYGGPMQILEVRGEGGEERCCQVLREGPPAEEAAAANEAAAE